MYGPLCWQRCDHKKCGTASSRSLTARCLLRGPMMTVQKLRHVRTGSMVKEDRERCRSWTLLSGQKIGMMTALSTMKENCGNEQSAAV